MAHPNPVIAAEMAGHFSRTMRDTDDVCDTCATVWPCPVMKTAEAAARVRNGGTRVRLLNDRAEGAYERPS
jgi:hypothetical protein